MLELSRVPDHAGTPAGNRRPRSHGCGTTSRARRPGRSEPWTGALPRLHPSRCDLPPVTALAPPTAWAQGDGSGGPITGQAPARRTRRSAALGFQRYLAGPSPDSLQRHTPVSYTHLRAHETVLDLVCRLLL